MKDSVSWRVREGWTHNVFENGLTREGYPHNRASTKY